MSGDLKDQIAAELTTLLRGVDRPRAIVNAQTLIDGGIPRRYAESISHRTLRVTDADALAKLIDDAASWIADDLGRLDGVTDPAELAANVPRWA